MSNRNELCGFKKIKKLGQGSGGTVYLVELPDGRKKAVKISIEKIEDLDKIIIEIDILSHFCHPNIISSLEVYGPEDCQQVKSLGYVMDYYPHNLYDYMRKNMIKNWKEYLKIIYDIALGMYFLHSFGILHCDIKEDNIAVDNLGNATILDPGLSLYNFGKKKMLNKARGTIYYTELEDSSIQKIYGYDYSNDVWAYSMLVSNFFDFNVKGSCKSKYDIRAQENYAGVIYSEKHKKETIDKYLCWDKNFWNGIDEKLVKKFLYFLIEIDKAKRPTFKQILNHRIFDLIDRNLELEDENNFTKYIYRYNFSPKINPIVNQEKAERIFKLFNKFLFVLNAKFSDIDAKVIFLYHELFVRLFYSLDLDIEILHNLAIFFSFNVLEINYHQYSSEKKKYVNVFGWENIDKYVPKAIKVLDGIIYENRVYGYCKNLQDMKKYFYTILKSPFIKEIYENNYINNIKDTKFVSKKLEINCMNFLLENYDYFVTVENLY